SSRRRQRLAPAFFLQAEDGIRAFHVTGVQTCALPIWLVKSSIWGILKSPTIWYGKAGCVRSKRDSGIFVPGNNTTFFSPLVAVPPIISIIRIFSFSPSSLKISVSKEHCPCWSKDSYCVSKSLTPTYSFVYLVF